MTRFAAPRAQRGARPARALPSRTRVAASRGLETGDSMPEFTPLHDVSEAAGAQFVETTGYLMPARYGDATAEYRFAREGAALFDVSHRGKLELTGPDAPSFLHNLCTNDVV